MKKSIPFFLSCFLFLASFSIHSVSAQELPQFYHTAKPLELRQTLEEAILNAKESILIFTFSFSDPGFIELVNQKAEEGIDVVIVIDKDHRGSLLSYGSDKLHIVTQYHGKGRVHHKILVIDDKHVWLGSANLSTSAFSSQENLVVGVESALLAQALRHEAAVFQGKQTRTDGPPPTEFFGDQEVCLYLLPHADPKVSGTEKEINKTGKQKLLSLIKNAKHSIRIAMMVWTEPELAEAVMDAHRRGVPIEVLFADGQDTVYANLKRAGVSVLTNPHLHFMHNKWMSVDERTLVNGSANWSRSSFSRNDESFFVLENLNEEQRSYLEEYWIDLTTRGN